MEEFIRKSDARAAVLKESHVLAFCIDNIKPVDAVEVTRYKNCKQAGYIDDTRYCFCWNRNIADENGFCSEDY